MDPWFDLARLTTDFTKIIAQRDRGILTDSELVSQLIIVSHRASFEVPAGAKPYWYKAMDYLVMSVAGGRLDNMAAIREYFPTWLWSHEFQRWYGACDALLGIGDKSVGTCRSLIRAIQPLVNAVTTNSASRPEPTVFPALQPSTNSPRWSERGVIGI